MEELGKHPFNYHLEEIRNYINDLVKIGQTDYALKAIQYIQIQYSTGVNTGKFDVDTIQFYHLKDYLNSDLTNSIFGECYADGSKYKFIYELNQLSEWVKSKQTEIGAQNYKGRENYGNKKEYKDGASIEKLALFLFFKDSKSYNHDFQKIATEYNFTNGEKLKKTFSILTNPIRRNGNCKELESQIQKLNRIKEYKWAIERLSESRKEMAINEMLTLEARLTTEE